MYAPSLDCVWQRTASEAKSRVCPANAGIIPQHRSRGIPRNDALISARPDWGIRDAGPTPILYQASINAKDTSAEDEAVYHSVA